MLPAHHNGQYKAATLAPTNIPLDSSFQWSCAPPPFPAHPPSTDCTAQHHTIDSWSANFPDRHLTQNPFWTSVPKYKALAEYTAVKAKYAISFSMMNGLLISVNSVIIIAMCRGFGFCWRILKPVFTLCQLWSRLCPVTFRVGVAVVSFWLFCISIPWRCGQPLANTTMKLR